MFFCFFTRSPLLRPDLSDAPSPGHGAPSAPTQSLARPRDLWLLDSYPWSPISAVNSLKDCAGVESRQEPCQRVNKEMNLRDKPQHVLIFIWTQILSAALRKRYKDVDQMQDLTHCIFLHLRDRFCFTCTVFPFHSSCFSAEDKRTF